MFILPVCPFAWNNTTLVKQIFVKLYIVGWEAGGGGLICVRI